MEANENALTEQEPPVVEAPHPEDAEAVKEEATLEVSEEKEVEAQAEPDTEGEKAEETAEEKTPEKEAKIDEEPEPDSEIKKEIEKLNKRLGYEQRQREKLEKQLRAQATPEPRKEDTAAPKEGDFETYEEYQQALIDYKVERGISDYQKKVASTYQQSDLKSFIEDTTERGREKYSDFDTVALADTVPITQPMLQIMQECENAESIAYYLGKNNKEATAISRMSPTQAARAIGKIEAKVHQELTKNPDVKVEKHKKIVSNAPPPVKPTGSGHVVTKDPEKMTQAEYEAWRAGGGGT